jgi:uncharacterized repeat protein (TIGR01451 family)
MKEKFSRLTHWATVSLLAGLGSIAFAQPSLNLPPNPVTPTVTFSGALNLPAYFTAQFPGAPNGFDIKNNQTYLAWCAQENGDLNFPTPPPNPPFFVENTATYNLFNTYPNSGLPSLDQSPNWPQVNYILNHKNGASVVDIQEAIWFLLDGSYHSNATIGAFNGSAGATALLNDAATNGTTFVPQPGQIVAIFLAGVGNGGSLSGTGVPQDLLIEVSVPTPPGGTIGDFVWRDTNKNGIQECGELGINGVTVQLYQNSIAPGNLVATTVTGPAPAGYTTNFPLACQENGYYQFTGLQPGNYIVVIPAGQPVLNGLTLTLPLQGPDRTVDSNGLGGTPGYIATANVNVPTVTTVDETIDFGFFAPINPATTLTTKSVSPGTTVEVNTIVTVVVTETNTGDSPITNITVAGGGACTTFTPANVPSLSPGASVDFTCTFNSGNASGSWSAAASGADADGHPAPSTNESTSGNFIVIHPATTLTTKSVSPATTVEPNTNITVVVTEKNTGDSTITNINVAGGGSCASFTPANISLAAGASQDFTCTFNSGNASGSWTAAASGTDAAGNSAPSAGENTSGSFTVIHPSTTLTTASVSPGTTVEANTAVTVVVTEKNTGDSTITSVMVTGGGACASFSPASVASLAPGATANFTCTFNSGNASGSWTAQAIATDAAGNSAPSANESASGSFTVIHPSTTLSIVSAGTTFEANSIITVVVAEKNTGDTPITNVSVGGSGACSPASVASLAPGASANFTCTFNSGNVSGSWTESATATDSLGNTEPSAGETVSGTFTVIHPSTTLTTTSVSPGTTVPPNTIVTVVVTEKNTGDSPITNVSVAGGGACASFSPASVASLAPGASANFTCTFNSGTASGSWAAAASATDALGNPEPSANESTSGSFTVVSQQPPQLIVTKVPDAAAVVAGNQIGFTVTISNPGGSAATGLTLSDPLPAGGNEFFNWKIDTTTGNPANFAIVGSAGSQSLAFSSSFLTSPDSLAAGQSISVHITTPTTNGDVSGGAVGLQAGVSSSAYLGAAGNYGVLYMVGAGTHNLSITNVTLGANVGIGSAVGGNGIGNATFSGPGIITGRVDFAPGQTNVFNNQNGSNVGPASVNTNVASVTSAIATVTSLSSTLGALTGTNIAINGTQTINESAGTPHTVNGVTYSVFTVTSYNENDGKLFTINGDGSGNPVVLNFGPNTGNFNLGGDVALTGNGLNDDKVIWNFTSSNKSIQLNNNASSFPSVAFHGIILAPNDGIHLVNANLSGRVFGGDDQDMQLVSGLTLHAPIMNTATVSGSNVSSSSSSATITVTGPFLPYAHFVRLNVHGGPGVFNLAHGDDTGLGGQIVLAGNLPPGHLMWNLMSIGKGARMNTEGAAFRGITGHYPARLAGNELPRSV